jgi:hypothetical protein
MQLSGIVLANNDFMKTLLYGLFTGTFLAAGAFSLAFLVDFFSFSFLELVDFGLILLFVTGMCIIIGFFLDGRHTSRALRRKNILEHHRMLALKYEQQSALEQGRKKKGSEIFKSGFSTQNAVEDIEDYAGRFTFNKGMILMMGGLFDFLFLVYLVLIF